MRIGLGIGLNRVLALKPNGNPSACTLTVISDTELQVDWTNGASNQDGTKIYYSLTELGTYTLGNTIVGSGTSGTITGLSLYTTYYVKLAHYKGSKISNYSNTANDTTIPQEIEDCLIFVNGEESGGILEDLSGNNNDVTIGTNLVPNGNCEGDWGFVYATNPPATLERSSEQAHSGTYSWKVGCSVIQVQGIRTAPYSLKVGDQVTFSFWIRRYAGAANIRWLAYDGDGLTTGVSANYTEAQSPDNTWVQVTGSFTATKTGSLARIVVNVTTAVASWYVDDFIVSVNGVNTLMLPENSAISDNLITASTYYTSGHPIPVRNDSIVVNQNDQVFFYKSGSSYKILVYNKKVNATVLYNILQWFGDSYSTMSYFTTERTIIAPVAEEHKGFHKTAFIGNRLYVVYRDGSMHTSLDGVTKVIYSDDFGNTWSSPVSIYDASEILTEYPQILIDDPRAVAGAQGGSFLQLDENTMLIFTGAVAGHMMLPDDTDPADSENVCIRVVHSYYNCFFTVPIVNGVLDLDNKVKTEYSIGGEFGAGFTILHDGILYKGTYLPDAYLWKSIDYGANWTKVSKIFDNANEMTAQFIGERLHVVARDYDNNGIYAYSDNYGVTWSTAVDILPRLDGQCSILLPDNGIIIFGRNATDYSSSRCSFYKLEDGVVNVASKNPLKTSNSATEDIGYGSIILKNGVYYFTYHDGPLSAAPNKYDHADAGIYFKAVKQDIIDNL